MICSEGMWDVELPSKLWDFFLVQFLEIAKFTTFEFERFPLPGKSDEGKASLVILTDASLALVIHAFLVYPTDQGQNRVHLLTHQSHLASTIKTIPKRELMALCYGAQLAQTIVSELPNLIKDFMVASDSRVSLFWVLNQNNTKLELFIANRVETIRNSLNLALEQLQI